MASHGKVVVTTRNYSIAFAPAEIDIEVLPFGPATGSKFMLHLFSVDIAADVTSGEVQSAHELSEKLGAHTLATTQMAGFIHPRSWTIEEFLAVYDNTQKMHSPPGYTSLNVMWQIFFGSMDRMSSTFLGVLSKSMPDSVPQALFETHNPAYPPESLSFCSDAYRYKRTQF